MIKKISLFCFISFGIIVIAFSCKSTMGTGGTDGDNDDGTSASNPYHYRPPVEEVLNSLGQPLDKWDGTTSEEPTKTADGAGFIYDIENPNHLAWLSEQSEDFTGDTIKFLEHVNMNDLPFNGITTFAGTMDGNDKTIYGLNINKSSQDKVGLIGTLKNGAGVNNLAIADSTVVGKNMAGAFAGEIEGSTTFSWVVNVRTDITGSFAVGGIVGAIDNNGTSVSFDNTANSGTITGTGGATGVAGIIGLARKDASFTNVNNTGNIVGGANSVGVAGIAGYTHGTTLNISKVENSGDVTGSEQIGGLTGYTTANEISIKQSANHGNIRGNQTVGGITGYYYTYRDGSRVENVGNSGDIVATSKVGGIFGYIDNDSKEVDVNYAYNYYSLADIASQDKGGIIGGVYETSIVIKIQNSYFLDTSQNSTYNSVGPVGGLDGGTDATKVTTDTAFRDESTFVGWDFLGVWGMGSNYPILK